MFVEPFLVLLWKDWSWQMVASNLWVLEHFGRGHFRSLPKASSWPDPLTRVIEVRPNHCLALGQKGADQGSAVKNSWECISQSIPDDKWGDMAQVRGLRRGSSEMTHTMSMVVLPFEFSHGNGWRVRLLLAALWMVQWMNRQVIWRAAVKLPPFLKPAAPILLTMLGHPERQFSWVHFTQLLDGVWSLVQVLDPVYGDFLPGR